MILHRARALVNARRPGAGGPTRRAQLRRGGPPASWRAAHRMRGLPVVRARRPPSTSAETAKQRSPGASAEAERVRGGTPAPGAARDRASKAPHVRASRVAGAMRYTLLADAHVRGVEGGGRGGAAQNARSRQGHRRSAERRRPDRCGGRPACGREAARAHRAGLHERHAARRVHRRQPAGADGSRRVLRAPPDRVSPDAVWFYDRAGLRAPRQPERRGAARALRAARGQGEAHRRAPRLRARPANPWPEAFTAFSDQIAATSASCAISSSPTSRRPGPLERAATEVC